MLWAVVFLVSCAQNAPVLDDIQPDRDYPELSSKEVKNVIFFLGDGMGANQVRAAGLKFLGPQGKLHMERMPFRGSMTTSPADDRVTDSAAGATALAIGHKSLNGFVGITAEKVSKTSLLEKLKGRGYATGIITTAEITDASPAAYYAHVDSREKHDEIAKQLVNSGIDIIFGGPGVLGTGGSSEDLIEQFLGANYHLITSRQEVLTTNGTKLLGLFEDWGSKQTDLNVFYDLKNPDLSTLVRKALDVLSTIEEGFFLFVEDEGIDTGGHNNLTGFVLDRMKHLDDAIGAGIEFALENRNTLVLVTADHETGGLTLLRGRNY